MTLRDHVKDQIALLIGFIEIQVKALEELKDKSTSDKYREGVQDCIDILDEAILTGLSITDDEIEQKHRTMKTALEAKMANKIGKDN
jgi:hypothetical protein